VEISQCLVSRGLSLATVRRSSMIVDITMFLDNFRKYAFIYVTCGEIGLPIVRFLIGIIQFKPE
jgi:hypothetical protein